VLQNDLAIEIEVGFGHSRAGEDVFDAFIGLLGMIEAVYDPSRCAVPLDTAVLKIEGWTLGSDPANVGSEPIPLRRRANSQAIKKVLHQAESANTPVEDDRALWCPGLSAEKIRTLAMGLGRPCRARLYRYNGPDF
jgi:hypothetical protein